jgi:6,7-dimethyl-8-ribityllumazine synthase
MQRLRLGAALKNVRQDFEERMGQSTLKVSKASASAVNAAWSGKPPRVAVICASWHAEIVNHARDSLQDELSVSGVAASAVEHFSVPGAFEIPLHAQRLAQSGRYEAVIACALVVNGGIYRHEFVSSAVIDGLMRVQLDTGVPVFSAVLTPRDFHEHEEHRAFFTAHFVLKGREVAQACVKTLHSLRALPVA